MRGVIPIEKYFMRSNNIQMVKWAKWGGRSFDSVNHFRIEVLPMRIVCSVPLILLLGIVLSGCASTHFQITGPAPRQPLCQGPNEQASALVFWGPKWRPDQKNVPFREAAAERGMERFLSTSKCFAQVKVIRKIGDRESIDLSPEEVSALAGAFGGTPRWLLFITIRELGPIVKLFTSLALVEGGTDVVVEIRAVSPSTGQTITNFTAHWQNGGPWVIKGVKTLEQDMAFALQEAIKPSRFQE
jgi:hypothetical protein